MLLLYTLLATVAAQINLGSFNFHPTNNGGWDLGLGQGVNIFGFGGDRSLQLGGGPGSFGLKSGGGALVGGERVGVDSGLGVQSNGGVDLGSKVNFGNTPAPPLYPGGQFGAFLDNIKRFFAGMVPPPAPLPMPAPLPLPLPVSLPTSLPMLVTTTTSFPTLRSHISTEGMESASSSRGQEAFSGEVETLDAIDGETESVDKLFERVTQRPRELPGLVEFGEE